MGCEGQGERKEEKTMIVLCLFGPSPVKARPHMHRHRNTRSPKLFSLPPWQPRFSRTKVNNNPSENYSMVGVFNLHNTYRLLVRPTELQ